MNPGVPVRRINVDGSLAAAARGGDSVAFARLTERYRRELQIHCYRMLGSVEDAEDTVQETLLRAWTKLDSYAGRASFRAWLYGIATNACLDTLRRRKTRAWPTDLAGPADPNNYELTIADLPWLQPYPDRLLEASAPSDAEPDAIVTAKETLELAFLTAIQQLPARQRAVLILRDVLEWSARETANSLDMTEIAVNSALQRAHATMSARLPAERGEWTVSSSADQRALVQRMIDAFERADAGALVRLLRADARMVMPPALAWFDGREAIERFIGDHVFGEMGVGGSGWRAVPTAANRSPAIALYWRNASEADYRSFAICVLRIQNGAIANIDLFQQPELFETFALPATL